MWTIRGRHAMTVPCCMALRKLKAGRLPIALCNWLEGNSNNIVIKRDSPGDNMKEEILATPNKEVRMVPKAKGRRRKVKGGKQSKIVMWILGMKQ